MRPLHWTLACILALTSAYAWSQPTPPRPSSPPPLPADPSALVEEVAKTYRDRDIAERISVRVTNPTTTSAQRSVLLHSDPKKSESSTLRRLHLDLSRLELWLNGDDCFLTNRADSTTYFQTKIIEPISFDALFEDVRPIPIPQIGWCLGSDAHKPLGLLLGETTWQRLQPRDASSTEIIGSAATGEVRLIVDNASRRVRAFTAHLPRGVVLELTCSPASGTPWSLWSPNLAGRTRVYALSQLQSSTPTAIVGQKLPSITYITTAYEGWILPKSSDEEPLAVAFLKCGTSGEVADGLRARAIALLDIVRGSLQARSDKGTPQRLVLVGVLAPGNTQPEDLAKNASAWLDATPDNPLTPVWTTVDWSLIAGGHPDANLLLHIVGTDRKLIATIPCEDPCDPKTLAIQLRAALATSKPPTEPSK